MIKAGSHPFLTFIVSGFAAVVLVGGAFATLQGASQTQDIATQAYGSKPMQIGTKGVNPLVCGRACRVDSECGPGGFCLTPRSTPCPAGKACPAIATTGTCRAAACTGDSNCSCATNVVHAPTNAVPFAQ